MTKSGLPIDEYIPDTAVQIRPTSLPVENGLPTTDHNRNYTVGKHSLYPLPILSSTMFFPSIDYSCQNGLSDSDLQLSSGVIDMDGFQNSISSDDVALSTPSETFGIPEQDEISKSAFDFLGPLGTLTPITSDFLFREENTGRVSPARSAPTTASTLLACHPTAINDAPSTWDATIPPAASNISLEDLIAVGMQVLLFNRASPYINTLDTPRTRTLTACLHNARSMGFLTSDVIKPSCIAPSLFYRPHSPGDNHEALVASATNPNTPAHLQPTLPQVLYQHPAFLDLIPIPGFRSKVILTAVRKGWGMLGMGSLDLFDLKRDMFQDGLAWRSYDGYGNEGEKGQPWDMRSWEASGWFVNKWRGLVDDDVRVGPA